MAAFESVFSSFRQSAAAVVVGTDPFFESRRLRIVDLAARYAVAAMYPAREYVTAGGLISYGISISDNYRQAGIYTGRLLNGAKVADLPVLQPTRFELFINVSTANKLGISVPNSMQLLADEVIE